MRFAGVLAYWGALLMAILGWRALRQTHARIAAVLLWYAAGFTLLHLPLVMNTRLRIPLLEPLLVMLAGAGWCSVVERWRSQRAASHASVAI
jgi:cytochrome c biogenesis protein CcdA